MITIQTLGRAAAIAAACTLVAVAPANAADPARAPAKPATTRYCVYSEVAGSRFMHYHCKTRDAWIKAEGFDPAK